MARIPKETPTTGAPTPKARFSSREAPPDDPIYNRGFAIGVTRSRNSSADTTKQESEPLPKSEEPSSSAPRGGDDL